MRKALLIGINDYPEHMRLASCENDASRMAHILSFNDDKSLNFSCQLLTTANDLVTKMKVRQVIAKLFHGEAETALFYFSGHGLMTENGGYLVTSDYAHYNEGVSFEEILSLANYSKIPNINIIFDCSHSGSFGNPRLFNNFVFIRKGVAILAATLEIQEAYEKNGGGIFTSLIVDALSGKGANENGDINILDVYSYVDRLLSPWNQRPVLKAHLTQLPVLRKCCSKTITSFPSETNRVLSEIKTIIGVLEANENIKGNIEQLKNEIDRKLNDLKGSAECKKVFISYSLSDRSWLKKIQSHLKPLIREEKIEIWDESNIIAGQDRKSEINQALNTCKIAVLLISPNFYESDFIYENVRTPLLLRAENNDTVIVPVILSHCMYDNDKDLSKYKPLNSPNEPIASMTVDEQHRTFNELRIVIDKIISE